MYIIQSSLPTQQWLTLITNSKTNNIVYINYSSQGVSCIHTYTYRRFFFITITTITNTANNIIAIIGIITPATTTPLPGSTGSLTTIQC